MVVRIWQGDDNRSAYSSVLPVLLLYHLENSCSAAADHGWLNITAATVRHTYHYSICTDIKKNIIKCKNVSVISLLKHAPINICDQAQGPEAKLRGVIKKEWDLSCAGLGLFSGLSFLLRTRSCFVWMCIPPGFGSSQPKHASFSFEIASGCISRHTYLLLQIIFFGEAPDLIPGDIKELKLGLQH